jgi:hypothetical protein
MEVVVILNGHLVYFMAVLYILWPFGIFYGVIWYIFPRSGRLHREKSGNPGSCVKFFFWCSGEQQARL